MTIELGNWLYVMIICSLLFVVVIMWYVSSKVPKNVTYWIIVIMLFSNFALHFVKQLLPAYVSDFPYSLTHSTFENICAVSVMLFPFIFLFGGKYTKDYMFYMGILSALGAFFFAGDCFGKKLDNFDTILEVIRYYLSHAPLIIAPVMMVAAGLHTLNYHRLWVAPLIFFVVLFLIFINELFLVSSGLVKCSMVDFFSRDYRNTAFIFGPPSDYDSVLSALYMFILPIFKYTYPGTDVICYVPILWLVLPVYVLAVPVCFLMSLPYEHHHVKLDYYYIKQTLKLKWESRK